MRQPVELLRGQQAGDRVEIIVLIEIEEDVAVVQVLDLVRRQSVRIRLYVLRGDRRQRQRQQQSAEQNRPKLDTHARIVPRHHSQSFIANSGWCFASLSVILSSRYLAPTPLSKLIVAPRR